jgi:hypothetical protein
LNLDCNRRAANPTADVRAQLTKAFVLVFSYGSLDCPFSIRESLLKELNELVFAVLMERALFGANDRTKARLVSEVVPFFYSFSQDSIGETFLAIEWAIILRALRGKTEFLGIEMTGHSFY